MPDNNGVFTPYYTWVDQAAAGDNIRADEMDTQDSDIASGITNRLTKNGLTTPTANLPMGGYRHTGVGDGVNRTDYSSIKQLQDTGIDWCGTAGGTANAITVTTSPAFTAYVTGMVLAFAASNANSGTTTINANGVGAVTIKKNANLDLTTGDIKSGQIVTIRYDGTYFQIVGGNSTNETLVTPVVGAGSAQTLNYGSGNLFDLTGTASTACTLTFSGLPSSGTAARFRLIWRQDAVTGGATLVWPAAVKWLGRNPQTSAPTFTTSASFVSEIELFTVDGGTTVYATLVGGSTVNSPSPQAGLYVAVGSSGKVSSSTDLVTFTAQTAQFSGANIAGARAINGRAHFWTDATGLSQPSASMKYTTDGSSFTAWASSSSGSPTVSVVRGVAVDASNNIVIWGLDNGGTPTSTVRSANGGTTTSGVSLSNNQYLSAEYRAVAGASNDILALKKVSQYYMDYSTNGGSSWNNATITPTGTSAVSSPITSLDYVNGNYIVGYASGEIGYKTTVNGSAFTNVASVVGTNQVNKTIWTGTKFIVACNGGKIANGTVPGTLTNRTTGLSGNITWIEYNSGVTMCCTDIGEIARSTDNGDTWTVLSTAGGTPANPFGGSALNGIHFMGNAWVTYGAGGKGGRSDDAGLTFSLLNMDFGTSTINKIVQV